MIKCLKILNPQLKNTTVCKKEAVYLIQGDSFCEEHGMEILQDLGAQVAQAVLQQKLTLPTQPKSSKIVLKGE